MNHINFSEFVQSPKFLNTSCDTGFMEFISETTMIPSNDAYATSINEAMNAKHAALAALHQLHTFMRAPNLFELLRTEPQKLTLTFVTDGNVVAREYFLQTMLHHLYNSNAFRFLRDEVEVTYSNTLIEFGNLPFEVQIIDEKELLLVRGRTRIFATRAYEVGETDEVGTALDVSMLTVKEALEKSNPSVAPYRLSFMGN